MTIPPHPQVRLYPHDPSTLIPLLRQHTPRSLPVLSTILENIARPSPSSPTSSSDQTILDDKDAKGYNVAYATFAHIEETTKNGLWAIVVRMQEHDQVHLRFYCSAERDLSHVDKEEEIQYFVRDAARCIVEVWSKKVVLGAIDSRWNKVMREEVDARELVECSVFLSPVERTGRTRNEDLEADHARLKSMGLELDIARGGDVEMIKSTCDVPRPHAYYASRAPLSTVIRRISAPHEAVCWVITHADGALGALYTLPEWRRKGLGEVVVKHNVASRAASVEKGLGREEEQEQGREFCYVFKGNHASEGLWAKMGWQDGWGVRWIVNREVEEARGKVSRFSHPDEETT